MNIRKKLRIKFAAVIILAILAALISYPGIVKFIPPVYNFINKTKINLGLDLQGGIHLEYKADISGIDKSKVDEAVQGAQSVIERRINAFGVGEPLVQASVSGGEHRIIIELPGIKNIEEAKNRIKETPFLEFKEEGAPDESKQIPQNILDQMNDQAKQKADDIIKRALAGEDFVTLAKENSEDPGSKDNGGDLGFAKKGMFVPEFDAVLFDPSFKDGTVWPQLVESQFGWHIIRKIEQRSEGDPVKSPEGDNGASNLEVHSAHILIAKKINQAPEPNYVSTGLSGKNLKSASVVFANQGMSEPQVSLKFDAEGTKLFADITKKNLEKPVAIYLDGVIISAPRVQSEITNGEAVITGDFTLDEAKKLASRLNEGALPVPLTLVSQQSIEASLGAASLRQSLLAGVAGFAAVMIFMLVYYRFLGLVAVLALLIYSAIMVSIFKLSGSISPWPITLTLSGIAGFILSIGMAVDANILIFERTKEEIRKGRNVQGALEEGFKRAWTSIRDGNVSSIITSLILIALGTGFVKGFALILIIGVLISMFTAVTISRTLLKITMGEWINDKLWLIGIKIDKKSQNQNLNAK
jgi:protein-export membrane protein SecD